MRRANCAHAHDFVWRSATRERSSIHARVPFVRTAIEIAVDRATSPPRRAGRACGRAGAAGGCDPRAACASWPSRRTVPSVSSRLYRAPRDSRVASWDRTNAGGLETFLARYCVALDLDSMTPLSRSPLCRRPSSASAWCARAVRTQRRSAIAFRPRPRARRRTPRETHLGYASLSIARSRIPGR
jgi:hypothetical protein